MCRSAELQTREPWKLSLAVERFGLSSRTRAYPAKAKHESRFSSFVRPNLLDLGEPGEKESELLAFFHTTPTAGSFLPSIRVSPIRNSSISSIMLRASLPRHLRQAKPLRALAQQSQLRGYKDFAFGNDARTRMAAGVDILAKAVSATLGPKVRFYIHGIMPAFLRRELFRAVHAGRSAN